MPIPKWEFSPQFSPVGDAAGGYISRTNRHDGRKLIVLAVNATSPANLNARHQQSSVGVNVIGGDCHHDWLSCAVGVGGARCAAGKHILPSLPIPQPISNACRGNRDAASGVGYRDVGASADRAQGVAGAVAN